MLTWRNILLIMILVARKKQRLPKNKNSIIVLAFLVIALAVGVIAVNTMRFNQSSRAGLLDDEGIGTWGTKEYSADERFKDWVREEEEKREKQRDEYLDRLEKYGLIGEGSILEKEVIGDLKEKLNNESTLEEIIEADLDEKGEITPAKKEEYISPYQPKPGGVEYCSDQTGNACFCTESNCYFNDKEGETFGCKRGSSGCTPELLAKQANDSGGVKDSMIQQDFEEVGSCKEEGMCLPGNFIELPSLVEGLSLPSGGGYPVGGGGGCPSCGGGGGNYKSAVHEVAYKTFYTVLGASNPLTQAMYRMAISD